MKALIISLCFTTITFGCSEKTRRETTADMPERQATDDDRVTITVRPWTARGSSLEPDSWVELYIEEHFKVDLEPWYGVDGYDTDSAIARFTSGDVPDWLGGFDTSWVDMGIVKAFSRPLIRKFMPGYMKWADYYLGDDVWRRTTVDDVNYGVPSALSMASTGKIMGFRADWLRSVGYEPTPVAGTDFYKGPDTLDEIEEVLLRFRNGDPDGNGRKDTYGYMVWKNSDSFDSNFLPTVFGAFGIRLDTWDYAYGEGYYSMVEPNYKRALKYINEWWEKELIHPDTVKSRRDDVIRAMSNDEFGAWSDLDSWQQNTSGGPWGAYLKNHPKGGVAYSVTPAGPEGYRGTWYRDPNWTPWSVGINASDAVTIRIMEMMEEIYTDKNVFARIFFGGDEDEKWAWAEDGYAVPVRNTENTTNRGARMIHTPHIVPPVDKVYISRNRHLLQSYIEQNQTTYPGLGFRPIFNDAERTLQTNLRPIEQEYAWSAITGQIDIDASWDEYVYRMMDAGLRRLLETVKAQS